VRSLLAAALPGPCAALAGHAVLVGCAALMGCAAPGVGLAPSILPNLGVAGSLAVPLEPASPWALEARVTQQFVDDKAFADNGLPEAGDWTQLDLGFLREWPAEDELQWRLRLGILGFRARGEPNLVDESGDYAGLYVGLARFRLFAGGLAFGPEITLVAATGPDPRVLVPQLTWGVFWSPRRASGGAAATAP